MIPRQIQVTTTSKPGVVAFAGTLPIANANPHTFTLYVRYNGQGSQITTTDTIQYNPGFEATFSDVDPNSTTPEAVAIYQLEGRGIVQGTNGLFRPTDPIARAEAAAIVSRALTWINEQGSAHFTDQGTVDSELWNDVNVLADYSVALGFGDGTYQPTTSIAQGQIISLITRAMVAKGYWQEQNDDGSFPQIPPGSGHRSGRHHLQLLHPGRASHLLQRQQLRQPRRPSLRRPHRLRGDQVARGSGQRDDHLRTPVADGPQRLGHGQGRGAAVRPGPSFPGSGRRPVLYSQAAWRGRRASGHSRRTDR